MQKTPNWLLLAGPLLAFGCASLDARRDVERSAISVEMAVGVPSEKLLLDAQAAGMATTTLLADGVTADEAVQIALLNNPRVRAALLSVGVSRADIVQSTLFTNPLLTLSLRLPDGGGLANFETTLTQNIAELWLIPARKRAAERDLDRTVLEAARTAASIALDARTAYVRALRAERQRGLAGDALAITERLVEVSLLRQQAGTGSEIDVNLARTQRLDAVTSLRNAELVAVESRAELAGLLGLSVDPGSLVLADTLPDPLAWTVSGEALQTTARANRLDLQIADRSVEAAAARLQEERVRFLKSVEVGFALERGERRPRGDRNLAAETLYDSLQGGQFTPPNLMPRERQGSDVILGPTFGVEVPLWDQNQAQIAKADRLLQQATQLRDAWLIETTQDIYARLAAARTAAENAQFYREERLPLAERSAALSREAYRAGHVPFLSVLEAERSLLTTRSGYVAALESAALTAVELERVTGRPASALRALGQTERDPGTQPARN